MNGKESKAEVRELLNRYVSIQRKIAELETEKKQLREKMEALFPEGSSLTDCDLGHCKVSRREICEIEYNEELLRERLGEEKYRSILSVDWMRVRANFEKLEPFMTSVIDLVGVPSADKVKAGIESGALERAAFSGAFIKRKKVQFAVSCMKQNADVKKAKGVNHVVRTETA